MKIKQSGRQLFGNKVCGL